MENIKRSFRKLVTRLVILGLVVICGAIAIAQAQKGRGETSSNPPDLTEPTTVAGTNADEIAAPNPLSVPAEEVQWVSHDSTAAQHTAAPNGQAHSAAASLGIVEPPAQDSRNAAIEQFVVDANVEAAQAVEPARNRFDEPFSFDQEQPSADTPEVDQPIGDPDTDALQPPDLLPNAELPSAGGTQAASEDTDLPPFPETAGGGAFLNDTPAGQAAPPSGTPDFQQPNFSANVDGAPVDAAGADAASGNPMRPSGSTIAQDPIPQQPAPIAQSPSFHDAASGPAFGDAGQLPEATYGENPVTLSGAGKPGPLELEGPQGPALTIHKIAPTDVRVGVPATFTIKVKNVGQVPAEQVLVRDEVPQATQLVNTTPQATTDSSGAVLWEIGTLRPQEDVTLTMQVTPAEEGVIGSVASVTFQALASARADVKKPMLQIEHSAKSQVLAGETVRFAITLENPGSGAARDVVIEEDVPAGLAHPKGPKLEYEVGTIPAGGQRRLELSLTASEPGPVQNTIVARGAGGLIAQHVLNLDVVAPKLEVKIKGPARRYLERQATYTVVIENPGTADARNVELVTQLPNALKFVGTNNSGRYDASTNTIRWSLDRLPARQFGEVMFTAQPMRKGDFNINAVANASRGLRASQDHAIAVEGIAALLLEVADQLDPIEVGSETTYRIRVQNQGTEDANNVQFVAVVPPGMRAVSAEGPTRYQIQGNQILFESIQKLPAKGESTYQVRVEGVQKGDQRFQVQMTSGEMTSPVVEEESTRVYAD